MNTLLGQIATYDDIKYPRYRLAFKLRRLQTNFLLHRFDFNLLQDIFHSTGLQPLSVEHEVTEDQLTSVTDEIYSVLKGQNLNPSALKDAQLNCVDWFMAALQIGSQDSRGTVGVLKIVMALFCGGKTTDKAKYIFGILARNGTVGLDGLQFFCEAMQLLANFLNEILYPDVKSVDRAMSECLFLVRDVDDIQDEEEDGGLQRPWLSCFELIKVFTASPPLNFLSWLELWYCLPAIEKVIHQVKCNICNKKTIKGFRYQCEECTNYNMCQMCFLKGRTSDNHEATHRVCECQDFSKSFKSRMGLKNSINAKVYRIMDEPSDPHTKQRVRSRDHIDGSFGSLNRLSVTDSPLATRRSPSGTPEPTAHHATVIRIGGSRDSLNSPKHVGKGGVDISITDISKRYSFTSNSSTESYDLNGRSIEGAISPMIDGGNLRRPSPIIPSLRRATHSGMVPFPHRSLQRIADEEVSSSWHRKASAPQTFPRSGLGMAKTCSEGYIMDRKDEDEFTLLNKKLSLEVDQLLHDIEGGPQDELAAKMSISSDGSVKEVSILTEMGFDESDTHTNEYDEYKKKQQVTNELDTLLGQIQQLHNGFVGLKDGATRVSPLPHNVINTDSTSHHRTGSLDLLSTTSSNTPPSSNYLTSPGHNRLSIVW